MCARELVDAHLARIAELNPRLNAIVPLADEAVTRLHEERSRLQRAWSAFFVSYPVVLGPGVCTSPWKPGADLDATRGIALIERATAFLLAGNALGLPALSLPSAWTGVQLYADLWREDLCLQAAQVLERAGFSAA